MSEEEEGGEDVVRSVMFEGGATLAVGPFSPSRGGGGAEGVEVGPGADDGGGGWSGGEVFGGGGDGGWEANGRCESREWR